MRSTEYHCKLLFACFVSLTADKPVDWFYQNCRVWLFVVSVAGWLAAVFTGFVLLSVSISNWRSLYTELCTALHLSDLLRRVADLPSRRRLRLATSSQLDVRPSRLVTVGDRSFASAGPKLWNSLPDDITSASSLSVLRKKLKTHLFRQSYADVIFLFVVFFLSPSWSLKLIVT